MPDLGSFKSAYTTGEAKALIAPMIGATAEDLGDMIIIARDRQCTKIGVFHTMYCSQETHSHLKAMDLVLEWLGETTTRLYELSPQHGPDEG